jgi:hypothetical protein
VWVGRSTDSKPKRIVVTALAALGLAIWFSFIALFEHYSATRPNRPDATAGRIYELNNHGSYAYLTKGEQGRLWCLEFGGVPFFLAAVALAKFWKIPTDTYRDIPKNVRDQIRNRPYQDYKKIRATYESDKNDADGT